MYVVCVKTVFFRDALLEGSFLYRQHSKFWKSGYLAFPLLEKGRVASQWLKWSLWYISFVPNFFFSHKSNPTCLRQTKNVYWIGTFGYFARQKYICKSTALLLVERSCSWMVYITRKLCGDSQQLDKLQAASSTALPHVSLSLNKPRDEGGLRLKSEIRTKL